MITYVIDTNFFVNLQRSINLGKNKEEVVENFVKLVRASVKEEKCEFLTTPEAAKEIRSFFETHPSAIDDLMGVITIASPSLTNIHLDATLFYELVREIGVRLYKGLRVAEEPIKEIVSKHPDNSPETAQTYIGSLREKYRRATREGFLDSTTDLGLILLARERDATLVTSDNGLLEWARKFGCKEMTPELLSQKVKSL
ncbi:MAG: RNA ligase partner protein [Patescibacteria group bacterium]|jgi:hypothetical protein